MSGALSPSETALLRLGRLLRDAGHRFVTPTPETHRRVNARHSSAEARTLADVFGWSRPFRRAILPEAMRQALAEADGIAAAGSLAKSRFRVSSIGDSLFFHSAFPTLAADSVFFGPDTYRFVRLVTDHMPHHRRFECVVDIGCGSGAGGILAARALAVPPARLILADISPFALSLARVNAALNAVDAETAVSDVLGRITDAPDLIIANPPYLVDPAHRLYRDGGGALGAELSLRILREGLARLRPGGVLILYTGSAIIHGEDRFRAAAAQLLAGIPDHGWRYWEIDPDVFGEELDDGPYRDADRIAATALVVSPGPSG